MSRRIHVVGIGGAGMSGIARVLHERGERVTGSDQSRSRYAEALERMGVHIAFGHGAELVEGADLVLASAAIPDTNVELRAARGLGIPVLRRDEFWGELTVGYDTIAVAGTHGKTTTTALIAWILDQAGLDPSFVVGANVPDLGTNARAGSGNHFIVEADEYRLAFLGLRPRLAVVTNIEHDHPDQFVSYQAVHSAFQSFVDGVAGAVILCADDPGAVALEIGGRARITYGLSNRADWWADELQPNGAGGFDFLVSKGSETLGLARTRLAGEHNVLNTLAAIAVCSELGIPFGVIRDALTSFHGAGQRFELVAEIGDLTIIDDYAHHPTEIRATLNAARVRYPQARIVAIFQPHTFSRTKTFLGDLSESFAAADHVIVTEVFPSRESPPEDGFGGQDVTHALNHPKVDFAPTFPGAAELARRSIAGQTVVVILSAGDANLIGKLLLEDLSQSGKGKEQL